MANLLVLYVCHLLVLFEVLPHYTIVGGGGGGGSAKTYKLRSQSPLPGEKTSELITANFLTVPTHA